MVKVKLEVLKVHDNDTGSVVLGVEARAGDSWNRVKTVTLSPSTTDAIRDLLLEDGQRLVLEPAMESSLYYDRDQAAVMSRSPSPERKLERDPSVPHSIPPSEEVKVTKVEPATELPTTEGVAPNPATAPHTHTLSPEAQRQLGLNRK